MRQLFYLATILMITGFALFAGSPIAAKARFTLTPEMITNPDRQPGPIDSDLPEQIDTRQVVTAITSPDRQPGPIDSDLSEQIDTRQVVTAITSPVAVELSESKVPQALSEPIVFQPIVFQPVSVGPTLVELEPPPGSFLEDHQVVSFYGHPEVARMGELGRYEASEAARRIRALAAEYDALNGVRDAIGALHLIVDVAQAKPKANGLYLDQMEEQRIAEYVEVAREAGILLFLDLQIGWSDALRDTERLERFLQEPFVHLALDPEFATARFGYAPGLVIGALDADEINAVQKFLSKIVEEFSIPPKILVLHQFRKSMLIEPERFNDVAEVEIIIDMDGFGGTAAKVAGFRRFAQSAYAEGSGFKLFYDWDAPVMSIQEVVEIDPDYIIYQ